MDLLLSSGEIKLFGDMTMSRQNSIYFQPILLTWLQFRHFSFKYKIAKLLINKKDSSFQVLHYSFKYCCENNLTKIILWLNLKILFCRVLFPHIFFGKKPVLISARDWRADLPINHDRSKEFSVERRRGESFGFIVLLFLLSTSVWSFDDQHKGGGKIIRRTALSVKHINIDAHRGVRGMKRDPQENFPLNLLLKHKIVYLPWNCVGENLSSWQVYRF